MGWALGATMGVQAAGGIVGAIGSEQQASANATASRYQSAVAANNAAIARNNSLQSTRVGEQKGQQQELKNRAQVSSIVAQQAGNGVDVNTGSAKAVQDSARILGRLDTMTIRSDAARESHAYDVEAQNDDAESKLLKKQAKSQKTAGHLGAFSSLLSSAASIGSSAVNAGVGSGGDGGTSGAPTPLSTGANVLNTDYWAPNDTGTVY